MLAAKWVAPAVRHASTSAGHLSGVGRVVQPAPVGTRPAAHAEDVVVGDDVVEAQPVDRFEERSDHADVLADLVLREHHTELHRQAVSADAVGELALAAGDEVAQPLGDG